MSGRHRGGKGHPLKSIQWLLMLVTLFVVPLAALGFIILLAIYGTDLELWAVGWMLGSTAFIQSVVRRSRDRTSRWMTSGWLLISSWNLFVAFAHHRKWPAGQLHTLRLAGYGVGLVALTLLAVTVVIDLRSGVFRRKRSPEPQK